MLHDKKSKTLNIRLSEQDYNDLQDFIYVNYGNRFTLSEFCRIVLMDYIFEPYTLLRSIKNNEQND